MSEEESWNFVTNKFKGRINLKDLFINSEKNESKIINNEYTTEKYNIILSKRNYFKTFTDNNNYNNLSMNVLEEINNNLNTKSLVLSEFKTIFLNKKLTKLNTKKLRLGKMNILSCFKLKRDSKFINVLIYKSYIESLEKDIYIVVSYYNKLNKRAVILESYIELLLYILKLEVNLKLNFNYSKIVRYPYEFNDIEITILNDYFNNLYELEA